MCVIKHRKILAREERKIEKQIVFVLRRREYEKFRMIIAQIN